MASPRFPILVRDQSVVVKIYRQRAASTESGWSYAVTWIGPNGREKIVRADLKIAREEAERKAGQLAAGLEESKHASRSDILEMTEARALAGDVPLLSALSEWRKARDLVGPALLEACHAWADRRVAAIERITVKDAVEQFIAEKDAAGKQGTRTYGAKLKPLKTQFGDVCIDTLTAKMLTAFLAQFHDGVTRNDIRKRTVSLFRWAKNNNHLPQELDTEIEKTQRAKEDPTDIGILRPDEFQKLLALFRKRHPHYLAAVVLAGFCGVRADEIHGKRGNREKRQVWEDIHLDRGFMSVTNAKTNTPADRIVHFSDAALAWLKICPKPHEGAVCPPAALERVRDIAITAGFSLPENCFRHSWISYRIALTGDKASTATEAGNSVKEIDRRYRKPLPKFKGEEWFAIRPTS